MTEARQQERTFWDEVVGIPLERWMAIRTSEELAELIHLRDAGRLYPAPARPHPGGDAPHRHDATAAYVVGSPEPVLMCHCGARVYD